MSMWEYFAVIFIKSFSRPFAIAEGALFVLTLVMGIIVRFYPQWEDKMKSLLILIPLGLLLVVFVLSLIYSGYQEYDKNNKSQQVQIKDLSSELEAAKAAAIPSVQQIMLQSYFKDVDIPIAGLSIYLTDSTMKHKTFERCNIIGPAVFALKNNVNISSNRFDGSFDSVFIVTTNKIVWGALALEDVTFLNCKFSRVGFIGPQDQLAEIKAGFSSSTKN